MRNKSERIDVSFGREIFSSLTEVSGIVRMVSEKSKINKETFSDDSKKKELMNEDDSTKKQEKVDKGTNDKIESPQSEDKK